MYLCGCRNSTSHDKSSLKITRENATSRPQNIAATVSRNEVVGSSFRLDNSFGYPKNLKPLLL